MKAQQAIAKNTKAAKTSRKAIRPGGGCLQTEADIARALGESEKTILNWRLNGVIPYIDAGFRSKRYRLEDVISALSKRTVRPKGAK
jgi:hypothetical protein